MSNKNLAQFTEVTTADKANKWLVGYDTTTGANREVKVKLENLVTADVNGLVNIDSSNGLKVKNLEVTTLSKLGYCNVLGEIVVDLPGMTPKRAKPSGWGGGVTAWDIYADGGTVGAGANGAIKAYMSRDGNGYFSNNLVVDKTIVAKSEARFEAPNTDHGQLRMVAGNRLTSPGIIHRNDGENFYIIQTKPNDSMGVWSDQTTAKGHALRNFAINLTGARDTWMTSPLNVYNGIGADYLVLRRENEQSEGGEIAFCRSSDNAHYWFNDVFGPSADPSMRWHNRGVVRLTLDANGNLTAAGDVSAFSDAKLKTNVKTIEGALGKVNALRGVEFEKISTGEKCVGVIAQEVEAVIPQVVGEVEGTKTVAYGNLVGVLIEAVKELTAEVEALKAQINK